jgi:hypothetical protein
MGDTIEVKSAPIPVTRAMSKDERAAKYADMRRRLSQSRIAVTPPPGRACRWARRDDQNDISLHEWWGFTISREPDITVPPEKRRFKTGLNPQADGSYVLGDVILMDIDEEMYEMYKEEAVERGRAQAGMSKEAFKNKAAETGVPTFDRSR